MPAEQAITTIRRGYDAFSRGDLDTLAQIIAADAVWHVAGRNRLSGAKQGREAIFAYFGALGQAGYQVDLHDVLADEQHVVGLHTARGEREGQRLAAHTAVVFHMRDGMVQEVWEQVDDTQSLDEFFR
ncbi:MAG: nuclear transport factor 2 family protein [Dehalococcoidia bacterium]